MMDRPRKPLGSLDVRNLGAGFHSDAEVKGLYLRVLDTGGRSYILRFMRNGRRRDMHLGSARELTLADARAAARAARAVLRSGRDPIDERANDRRAAQREFALSEWTFEKAAREVHAVLAPGWKNPKHADQWINTLATYVFPKIGHLPVAQIDVAGVMSVLRPIWSTKAETARRVRQRIDQVIRWAIAHGYAENNPVDAVAELLPKQRDVVEHHRALAVSHAPSFWTALSGQAATGPARLCLQFLVLTAARSGEARGARWSEIDRKAMLWTVPGDRMKAGRSHQVPLSPAVLGILDLAAESFGSDEGALIFPSVEGRPLSDAALGALLKRMKVGATAHGFRSTFRDWCAESGYSRELAERALAHQVADETEAAYNRTQLLEQRRPLMVRWAQFLEGGDE